VPSRAFRDYLTVSLGTIERDAPAVYALMGRCLGERRVRMDVGGEVLSVGVEHGRVMVGTVGEAGGETAVEARTTRGAIVALADGRATLEEAVMDGRMELRGSVEDLEAGMEALAAYLNGAARCPDLLGLMDEFHGEAAEGAGS
jgi:hypothetical protein